MVLYSLALPLWIVRSTQLAMVHYLKDLAMLIAMEQPMHAKAQLSVVHLQLLAPSLVLAQVQYLMERASQLAQEPIIAKELNSADPLKPSLVRLQMDASL